MSTNDMRSHIIAAYGSGEQRKYKVLKMSDARVLAIYKRLQKQGKVK